MARQNPEQNRRFHSLQMKPLEAGVFIPALITSAIMISNPLRDLVLSHHMGSGPLNPLEYFLAYNFGNLPFAIAGAYGIDFAIRGMAKDVGASTKSPTRLLIAGAITAGLNVLTETAIPSGTTQDINDIWAGFAGVGLYGVSTYLSHKSEY